MQTDEELRKAIENEQISAIDMEKLKQKLSKVEQTVNNLEKQKKSLENEWNAQKVRIFLKFTKIIE